MEGFTLVLLAAGQGRRFGGLKQLQKFVPQDATLAEYAIFDAWNAGFRHFVAIVSEETQATFIDIFKRLNLEQNVCYILQDLPKLPRKKPWGTGHALYAARHCIHTPFVIVNGDDFYGYSAYEKAIKFLNRNTQDFALVSYRLQDTLSPNGSVSRSLCTLKNGMIEHLQEFLDIHQEGVNILGSYQEHLQILDKNSAVSMNFWVLQQNVLELIEKQWHLFLEKSFQSTTAEFYLPMAIQTIAKQHKISIYSLANNNDHWFGITYAQDIQEVQKQIIALTQEKKYPQRLKILQ